MPQNCSADVQAVIQKVDSTLMGNDPMAIQALKDNWGLGPVMHLDDFAGACMSLSLTHPKPTS